MISEQVTLAEASRRLDIPVGTLKSWRSRGDLYPAGRAINPATNRMVMTYTLEEIVAAQQRHAANARGRSSRSASF